ncbi:MAG: hypothetical protein AAFN50_03430, partial [Pseudomonadota bacterium]
HGHLYFGAGGYLGKFSLADGSSDVVTGVGNANIREVDELYGKRLLLSLDAIENNREVAKITWLDVRTLQDTTLFAGVAAVWVPDVKTYVYDDGSRLSAASTHSDFRTDNVIMDHRINDIAEILVVSGTAILFQVGYAERREVWHYEVGSQALTKLQAVNRVCGLRHSVWIAAQNLLACRSESTGRYVLVGLDGEVSAELPLPDGHDFEAIEYIADQQLIVFSEPWRSALIRQPRNAVWVHELQSGRSERIAEHQYLGNSTAYRRE